MSLLEEKIRQRLSSAMGGNMQQVINSARYNVHAVQRVAHDLSMTSGNKDSQEPSQEGNAATSEVPASEQGSAASPVLPAGSTLAAVISKPGVLAGNWRNPYVAAAMPVVLMMAGGGGRQMEHLREQMVLEIQALQKKLSDQQLPPESIEHLSYLLCSYVDEFLMDLLKREGQPGNSLAPPALSLLVHFHGNAWGGEDCFTYLEKYLLDTHQYRDLLVAFDFVLSMGFEGKYRMIEHGRMLLGHLRNRLHNALYPEHPAPLLSIATPGSWSEKNKRLSPRRLLLAVVGLCLMLYAGISWYLHETSIPVQQAILAWEPPLNKGAINIKETLPPAMQKLLDSGWMSAVQSAEGWHLLIPSTNAFLSAKAELNPEFRANITQLGSSLAPWPGEIKVIGHTDKMPIRGAAYADNLALSIARAKSVRNVLQQFANTKYPDRIIRASGMGDAEPIADNGNEEGRSANRRVDIFWKIAGN